MTSSPTPEPRPNDPDADLTEAQILEREAAAARAAMNDCMARMKRSAADAASVSAWTVQHPWLMAGVAAGVGLMVGSALAKSMNRDGQEREPASTGRRRQSPGAGMMAAVSAAMVSRLVPVLQAGIETWIKEMMTAQSQRPRRQGPLEPLSPTAPSARSRDGARATVPLREPPESVGSGI